MLKFDRGKKSFLQKIIFNILPIIGFILVNACSTVNPVQIPVNVEKGRINHSFG